MANARTLVALMVAVMIGATLFTPIATSVQEKTGTVDVQNESVTADVDTFVNLDGYEIETNSETVYWYNSTSGSYDQVTSGTDYEMAYQNGSIHALSGGTISTGDDLKVSYSYQATTGSTTTVLGLITTFVALLLLVIVARRVTDML